MSGASIRDAERTRSWRFLLVICYNLLQCATATLCEATILLLASVKTHTGWMSAWLKVPSSIHTLSIQSGRKCPQGNQAPQSVQMSAQCVFPIAASMLMGDDTVGPDREREIRLDGDASTKYLGAESLSRQKPFLTITASTSLTYSTCSKMPPPPSLTPSMLLPESGQVPRSIPGLEYQI